MSYRRCMSARLRRLFIGASTTFLIILFIKLFIYEDDFVPSLDNPIRKAIPRASFILIPMTSIYINTSAQSACSHEYGIGKEGIPRIIHQTWKSMDGLPETFRGWMGSWVRLNPDWQYWFWTDEEMRSFVRSAFPQFLSLYDNYPSQGYRADAFRYFVLYYYGGVYADLDMECLRPITALMDEHLCLVSQEPLEHAQFLSELGPPLVSNALMACRPGHPFFARVIGKLRSYSGLFTWTDILHATGPPMLTDVYRHYHHSSYHNTMPPTAKVHLADPDTFQPAVDSSMVEHMRAGCQRGASGTAPISAEQRDALCARLAAHDFGRTVNRVAYTTHHWTHTWAGRTADPWGLSDMRTRFSVGELRSAHHTVYNYSILPVCGSP